MCRECIIDPSSDYPGGQAYSRDYREIFGEPGTNWMQLYAAQAFLADMRKDEPRPPKEKPQRQTNNTMGCDPGCDCINMTCTGFGCTSAGKPCMGRPNKAIGPPKRLDMGQGMNFLPTLDQQEQMNRGLFRPDRFSNQSPIDSFVNGVGNFFNNLGSGRPLFATPTMPMIEMPIPVEAFASQDLEGQFTVNKNGEVDFESNRRISERQAMQIVQDSPLFSNQERTQKQKAQRRSNNASPERVFPSGIVTVRKDDPFDQGSIDPGSVVPALRNQMPTFATNLVSANRISSACRCSRNFMWEDNRGSHCEVEGMPCNTPGQTGTQLL